MARCAVILVGDSTAHGGVVLEGMQTACGAILIPWQHGFVVDEAPEAPERPEAPRATPSSGLGLGLECLRHAAIHGAVSVLRRDV